MNEPDDMTREEFEATEQAEAAKLLDFIGTAMTGIQFIDFNSDIAPREAMEWRDRQCPRINRMVELWNLDRSLTDAEGDELIGLYETALSDMPSVDWFNDEAFAKRIKH